VPDEKHRRGLPRGHGIARDFLIGVILGTLATKPGAEEP